MKHDANPAFSKNCPLEFAAKSDKIIASLGLPRQTINRDRHKEFLETEDHDGKTEIFADHSFPRPRNI